MDRCTLEKLTTDVRVRDFVEEKRYEANVYSPYAMGDLVKVLVNIINEQHLEIQQLKSERSANYRIIQSMMRGTQ